jgi:tol-pal system protein YbgF
MIGHFIVRRARLTLLLVLIAAAVPVMTARSQDRTAQDRLDRMERDLSMLQRQVYRSGPTPIVAPNSGAAVDTELRMDRLEEQMRELTGRVEDAVNGVEQLRRRLEQINSDIDVRFNQGQGQPRSTSSSFHAPATMTDSIPAPSTSTRGPPQFANAQPPRPPDPVMPPGTLVSPPPRDPPAKAGTLTPPSSTQSMLSSPQPIPEATSVEPGGRARTPSSSSLPAGSPADQYNVAFVLLKQADYPAAEEALKGFIGQYPDNPLAGSAQYWLGETYYARGRYAEAASAFAEGYKRYPKGTKAPDDLLKLSMSLARDNQKHNACLALAQLDHDFPNPGNAIKERAVTEKKRLGC